MKKKVKKSKKKAVKKTRKKKAKAKSKPKNKAKKGVVKSADPLGNLHIKKLQIMEAIPMMPCSAISKDRQGLACP